MRKDAQVEASNRIKDSDCESFVNSVIKSLKADGLINTSIASAAELVSMGNNYAIWDIYGAINVRAVGLQKSKTGYAFAQTKMNIIHLGERFFDPALTGGPMIRKEIRRRRSFMNIFI